MNTILVIVLSVYLTIWVMLCFLGPFVNNEIRSHSKSQAVVFWVIMLAWPALMLWDLISPEKKSSRNDQWP